MLKQGKKHRKILLKILKAGKHDFIIVNKGLIIDGITQCHKLEECVATKMIEFHPLPFLNKLVIVEK